jgi:iron(III) transport system ATP-binding protein
MNNLAISGWIPVGSKPDVEPLDFEVESGEIVSLLDLSPTSHRLSGLCLAGLEAISTGQVKFNNAEIFAASGLKRLHRIWYQGSEPRLFPELSVLENIQWICPEGALGILQAWSLKSLAAEPVGSLLPIDYVRVLLARIHAVEPQCLIFDFPEQMGVDFETGLMLLKKLFEQLASTNPVILILTRSSGLALALSQRVVVWNGRLVVQDGSPMEIYRQPQTLALANDLGVVNCIEGQLIRVGGGYAQVRTRSGEWKGVWMGEADALPGNPVYIVIRPESCRLEHYPSEENGIQGNLMAALYLGSMARYDFRAEDGTAFQVYETNPRFAGPYLPHGIYLSVDPDHVLIYPMLNEH